MVVVAQNSVRLAHYAGGWLFDRAMAGWDVTVLLAEHADTRPVQILGAYAVDLDAALASSLRGPRPHEVATDTALYRSSSVIRRRHDDMLSAGRVDVRLWGGDDWPNEIDRRFEPVQHELSFAARAFKAQALAASAAPVDSRGVTEIFRSHRPSVPTRRSEDLISAS